MFYDRYFLCPKYKGGHQHWIFIRAIHLKLATFATEDKDFVSISVFKSYFLSVAYSKGEALSPVASQCKLRREVGVVEHNGPLGVAGNILGIRILSYGF